jgi:hypothetical protein
MSDSIEFLAYLPPIQSAIMMSGDGDLMQIKLNVNLKLSPEAIKLMMLTGKRLNVTIEEVPESLTKPDNEVIKEAEKRTIKVGRRRS